MKVAFITLGCKVNYYETKELEKDFLKYGFTVVEPRENADVYIVNTCTVTNIADRKSRQMLHRVRKQNKNSVVVAVGCYAQSGEKDLINDEAVDAIFFNDEKPNVANEVVDRFFPELKKEEASHVEVRQERTRAYIKIQDGCNMFCSYCLIPYVRGKGKLKSMSEDEVVNRAINLANQGYKEIVLTGIHLSSYGVDKSKEINFVKLEGKPLLSVIQKVSEIDGIERIRLGSLEPRIITESFASALAKIKKVCPHFHLSLQSGCDDTLKRMNRHYTTVEYRKNVEMLRKYFENPAITTDVIVGFPGETKEEFEHTLAFLEEIELSDIHVFPYSVRTGTKAEKMEGKVSPEIKKARTDILLALVQKQRNKYCSTFVEHKEKVLFEEIVEMQNVDFSSTKDGLKNESKSDAMLAEGKYLVGHNERYVKIFVPYEEALLNGYKENEIHEVVVKNCE